MTKLKDSGAVFFLLYGELTYLLTYNLASVGGPKCPGQSPIDVKSDEAIQI